MARELSKQTGWDEYLKICKYIFLMKHSIHIFRINKCLYQVLHQLTEHRITIENHEKSLFECEREEEIIFMRVKRKFCMR